VHGAVGEQREDGGADVAAACPRPTSAAPGAGTEAGPEVEPATAGELLAAVTSGMAWMAV
jgi:hypothetical protein